MLALATVVPIAICVMLATKRMEGTATAADRYALAIFVAARIIVGIASGLLSPVAFMGVILALVHTSKYRRLPVRAILIIVPVAMFLQVGKGAFRGAYWSGAKTGSILEKAQFWLEASFDQWSSALSHNSHNDRRGSHALLAQSVDRIALLPQAANVLAKTPGLVPYQKGRTYSYFAATLIPRAVWPNKPSINEANRFYQVAYGVTAKEDLEGVSIAVGCLTESFINFGWWGVMPVMFVIGVIVGVFERTLLTEDSGLLFWGVGMALLSNLLTIEFQAAQYLGGLLQQIAVVFVVVLPVIRRRKTHRQPGLRLTEAV
jgi:hypothetical protein